MASRTRARVTTFGTGADADVRLGVVTLDELGRPSFDLGYAGATEHLALSLLGEHHAHNAAAVTAAALAAGVGFADVAASLRAITALSKWRMQLLERLDGLRVINDAYNANPDSVRAALTTLAGIGRRTGSRTVAVLGEMRELGDAASQEHRAVGRLVGELGIDVLVVVGPEAAEIGEAAKAWVSPLHARDVREAVDLLRETVRAPDVVLVKASRGAALERVVEGLLASDDREEPDQ
jgi:UDP-N-acetylmuramoyl-tripeptide--D-alanyl-D-alanine ligase